MDPCVVGNAVHRALLARLPEFAAVVTGDVLAQLSQQGAVPAPVGGPALGTVDTMPLDPRRPSWWSARKAALHAASARFCAELMLPLAVPPDGHMFDFAQDDALVEAGFTFSRMHFARNFARVGGPVRQHYLDKFGQVIAPMLCEANQMFVLLPEAQLSDAAPAVEGTAPEKE